MRCPWCGSAVTISGKRWICGSCGDSGMIPKKGARKQMEPSFDTGEGARERELPEIWMGIQAAAEQCFAGDEEDPAVQLSRAAAYQISAALARSQEGLPEEKGRKLQDFLMEYAPASLPSFREFAEAARERRTLCTVEGILNENSCGSFWRGFIEKGHPDEYPEGLDDLFWNMSLLHEYFRPEGAEDRSYEKKAGFWDAFEAHWNRHKYFSPDPAAAIERIRRDDVSRIEDDCRDILVCEYPELFASYSLAEMERLSWETILRNTLYSDPLLAVRMWRTLLDAVGPDMAENSKVAARLRRASLFPEKSWKNYFAYVHGD